MVDIIFLIGICRNITFLDEDFTCDDCGETPAYIVADGKFCGPTTRKVDQLSELDRAENDADPLRAGSHFKARVFLQSKQERSKVKNLVTGHCDMEDFIDEDMTSENGQLIQELVMRLDNEHDEIPKEYSKFLADVAKYTSVSGYLQCTGPESLQILEDYCNEILDVRSLENAEQLSRLRAEFPPLMDQLLDIIVLERTERFLPPDVACIVLKLIQVRRSFFESSTERTTNCYCWIDENDAKEVSTQYYPNWRMLRLPKKYIVNNKQDHDLCNKNYSKCKDFCFGIFSIGCSCSRNITLGFEICLRPESPHNLFR